MNKTYHYVYITTDTLNGKQYIGKHSTTNLDDGYVGSGAIIKQIVKAGGKERLKKEILEFCSSAEEAYQKEEYYVQLYRAVESEHFYNLKNGGSDHVYFSEDTKDKLRQDALKKGRWQGCNNPKYGKSEEMSGENNPFYGKHHTEATKDLLRQYRLGTKHTPEEIQKIKKNSPNRQPVQCIETGEIYDSMRDAAKAVGLACCDGISRSVKDPQKSAGKHPITKEPLHWRKI